MRDYHKIPTTPLVITPSISPPTSQPHKANSSMFCYSIMVVAGVTLVLGIYHLIVIRLCTIQYHRRLQQEAQHLSHRTPNTHETANNTMLSCTISSFKYTKEAHKDKFGYNTQTECSVCLSVFEEGEEVKSLPMCNHCFHASCIDMWLYSHIRCPLCRAPVVPPPPPPPV